MDRSEHGFLVPFRFPVYFTRDAFAIDNRILLDAIRRLEPGRRHRVMVVVDSYVAAAHAGLVGDIERYVAAFVQHLQLAAPPAIVAGGEAAKNDVTHPFRLLQLMNDVGLDRQSFVTVVGGGAVLDMVSFAAAIAHRGIRVVRLPTTVLSQCDSGVAVKNGINLFGKKNFVGTFAPPFAVVNDTRFLESLDRRDRIGGVVEAIKVALLKDPEFYEYLEAYVERIAAGDIDILSTLARRSAELHLAHICGNGDPFELGSARPLDFGHWAAHKLESMSEHRLRHGEAVAIGMALDLIYSVKMKYLEEGCGGRILRLLEGVGFKLWDEALVEREPGGALTLLQGLQEFREHLGGELHITLVRGIGQSFEVTEMDEALIMKAIDELAVRAAAKRAPRFLSVADRGVR
jgi:3-dehydroquinate synthase